MILPIALLALAAVMVPADALAWGVGVHLGVGSHVLNHLDRLPAALQALLGAHPYDYLYGCISADITLGKKFTHYLQHCHSWRVGSQILDNARTDRQRACAYGYLSHLAADSIAHSYYVPFKVVRTFNTTLLKHAYWEVRFEAFMDAEVWALARKLSSRDFTENDVLMRGVLSDTIFSFETNRKLFNSLLLVNRLRQWQQLIQSLSSTSRWTLDESDRDEYFGLAKEATESILTDFAQSPYRRSDPTGERALNAARMIRRNLNLLWVDGKLPEREAKQIILDLKPRFKEGILDPDRLLELLSGY